jgi:rRNA maturation endonuclease Nob1
MYRGGDSVFRLSLVGIAFILICFLLIAFSRMYTSADVARTEAMTRLNRLQQEGTLPLTQQVFESAQKDLQAQLSAMGADPDRVIRDLLDKAKTETELATEKKRVQELGAQLAGLTEVRKVLTRASRTPVLDGTSIETLASALELRARLEQEFLIMSDQDTTKLTDSEISSRTLAAINFKRNIETMVERELGLPLVPGQEPAWGQWLLSDSSSFKSMLNGLTTNGTEHSPRKAGNEDNNTLNAQINFLRTRLETHGDKTAPPCWFDNAGKVQFLFTIELLPRTGNNITVKSAWPPAREASAQAIPGINQILTMRNQTYANFKDRARSIAQYNGQCRYSVQVIDRLNSGMRSEAIHKELETLFHLVSLPN